MGPGWSAAGQPELPGSDYLHAVADARTSSACNSGGLPGGDPMRAYDGEPAVAIVEKAGAAPFDVDLPPDVQEVAATEAIWAGWRDDPELTAARWNDMTVAQHYCVGIVPGEAQLYMTLVLRDQP
jgi:hypothetical protein